MKSTNILDNISVSAKHCDLIRFDRQFETMVTDGSWAIKRSAMSCAVKPPKFILEQLVKGIHEFGPTFESVAPADYKDLTALETQPILIDRAGPLLIPFYPVNPDVPEPVVYADARLTKLLQEMFPMADWYGSSATKPLALVQSGEVIAILMPLQVEADLPVIRQPSTVKRESELAEAAA